MKETSMDIEIRKQLDFKLAELNLKIAKEGERYDLLSEDSIYLTTREKAMDGSITQVHRIQKVGDTPEELIAWIDSKLPVEIVPTKPAKKVETPEPKIIDPKDLKASE